MGYLHTCEATFQPAGSASGQLPSYVFQDTIMNISLGIGVYLHRVDNDGEGRIVPLAAPFLGPAPGTFTAAMDGANSENTQDHHNNQETHTHHYDDGGCSWDHCRTTHTDHSVLK